METGILVPASEYQTGPGHLNMQCGTEAEIKERHRQTERWVGGGWGDTKRQRDRDGGRGVEREGVSPLISPSSEHPFLHIIISALLSCVTPLTPRKIDSLITTICKSACLSVH